MTQNSGRNHFWIIIPNHCSRQVWLSCKRRGGHRNILQQDSNGVLLQMEYGTFRYPLTMIKDVKKETATAPHVSNNGQVIPDWAQIVTMLANNSWAPEIKQVPAMVITMENSTMFPTSRSAAPLAATNLTFFGDLNNPAAVEIAR